MTATPTQTGRQRSTAVVNTLRSLYSRLHPLGVGDVRIDGGFWGLRLSTVLRTTLPDQYALLEESGQLDNFRQAAGLSDREFRGRIFSDSDVYKWLEAAAWALVAEPDPGLRQRVDETVALVAAAQEDSGYLNTYFTGARVERRWTDLKWAHEMYCAGHLMQAAVAHHRATGARDLLDVAVRFADHIDETFGPGRRSGACGHPEIEMALVELARETNESRYLRLAEFLIDQRGQHPPVISGEAYAQDHAPFQEEHTVVGHAVRALYLYSGATDVYAETGDQAQWNTLEALWQDLNEHKVYITGGVGARHEGESVGDAYELPNRRAYAETCAAIANVMWNWRMLLVTGEARFADALETALYNGMLSGISLDGRTYFYENPLADRGGHRRTPWFDCACCPPNVARLLLSLPGYVYTVSDEGLWVHLYASNTVSTMVAGAGEITLVQETDYPRREDVKLEVHAAQPAEFSLFLRIPGWCRDASIQVNGEPFPAELQPGSYAELRRLWRQGDVVSLSLPLTVRLMASHPYVTNNYRRGAIVRGPLVYCIEQVDHPGTDVWDLRLPLDATWEVTHEPDLLGSVVVVRSTAMALESDARDRGLYVPYEAAPHPRRSVPLTAIPYYAWANRDPGPMQTWIPIID